MIKYRHIQRINKIKKREGMTVRELKKRRMGFDSEPLIIKARNIFKIKKRTQQPGCLMQSERREKKLTSRQLIDKKKRDFQIIFKVYC